MIEGVLNVTKDKETSIMMGAHDHERCLAELSPGKTAEQFINMYKKMLNTDAIKEINQ